MQIFWLHEDIQKNARRYNDTHCNKIILEIGQIVSTAAKLNGATDKRLYSKTHVNHPVVQWAAESKANIYNALQLMDALNDEKHRRFGSGDHLAYTKIYERINWEDLLKGHDFPHEDETVPPQTFDEKYQTEGETFPQVVEGYKTYYRHAKADISEYKHSPTPEFMEGVL